MTTGDSIHATRPCLKSLGEELRRRCHLPMSTYRLQLRAEFCFTQARAIVPYLHSLGISDAYLSPYLKARPGSSHGYDIIDPQQLNPVLGAEADYHALVQALQQHDMGQLMDIVPNHLGVIDGENAWWRDILEHGQASRYAHYFDINWCPPQAAPRYKVLLPILGALYGEVLEHQALRLHFDQGVFEVHYDEHRLPIALDTTVPILQACLPVLRQQLGTAHRQTLALQGLVETLRRIPPHHEPQHAATRYRESAAGRQQLTLLVETCAVFRSALASAVQALNGIPGVPRSFDRLHALLEGQAYRLSYWRVGNEALNYRRFFDIVHLAGVRVEDPVVFDAMHSLILRLLERGQVTGIRVDHPDGLWDPLGYMQRLQQAVVRRTGRQGVQTRQAEGRGFCREFDAPPVYVVVEKILEGQERLPEDWPVHGTTGYDFLNQLNGLFVDASQADAFRELYADFIGERVVFADLLYTTKTLIMQTSLVSELEALADQLARLADTHRYWRDIGRSELARALQEVVACFPVYRTYTRAAQGHVNSADRAVIETALRRARERNPRLSVMAFDMLQDVLLLRTPDGQVAPPGWLQFVQRVQQITGPVMAKGLEDTAFYRYTPLLSLNEVGGDPDHFGTPAEAFHQQNLARQQRWPFTLLATSTHDTKRSEDVRARLNVLSELPQQWQEHLWRWHNLNAPQKSAVNGLLVPAPQEEYLLYQTLLGAWPFEPTVTDTRRFGERIRAYMRKALREAKIHTTWSDPQYDYEEAVDRFIVRLLDDQVSTAFLDDFRIFQQAIAQYGMWNGLAQILLKIASPGVPDIYQGCELWDFSLVDPDNRRPVDYALRQRLLVELQQRTQDTDAERLALVRELLRTRQDGRIKLYVTWQALTCRRERMSVFREGGYVPLEAEGGQRAHLCAFARVHQQDAVLVLVPRLVTGLLRTSENLPLGASVWGETRMILPDALAGAAYRHRMTGEILHPELFRGHAVLPLATVFAEFPVAILEHAGL